MEETIAICIASYNTLSTRREGLDTCLKGLSDSIKYFKVLHPEIRVVVSWVDDASTDGTYGYTQEKLRGYKLEYHIKKLKVNSHQGYCRNLATKLVDSDYIMFCDSDDVFLEKHIKTCYDVIRTTDSAKRMFGIASTTAYLDPELRIHPDWIPRISSTIPITKIVRRDIWEFMEGFPVNDIYRRIGCEDEDFMMIAQRFFGYLMCRDATVEYKSYPGSFFERQLPKFRKHPNFMEPDRNDVEKQDLHKVRLMYMNNRVEYLKSKLVHTEWYNKLEKYVTTYV